MNQVDRSHNMPSCPVSSVNAQLRKPIRRSMDMESYHVCANNIDMKYINKLINQYSTFQPIGEHLSMYCNNHNGCSKSSTITIPYSRCYDRQYTNLQTDRFIDNFVGILYQLTPFLAFVSKAPIAHCSFDARNTGCYPEE